MSPDVQPEGVRACMTREGQRIVRLMRYLTPRVVCSPPRPFLVVGPLRSELQFFNQSQNFAYKVNCLYSAPRYYRIILE
jgi:hypothetical protein